MKQRGLQIFRIVRHAVVSVVLLAPFSAHASLIGTSVEVTLSDTASLPADTYVVGTSPTLEYVEPVSASGIDDDSLAIDIDSTTIFVDAINEPGQMFWRWQTSSNPSTFSMVTLSFRNLIWMDDPSLALAGVNVTRTGNIGDAMSASIVGTNGIDVVIPDSGNVNPYRCDDGVCGGIAVELIRSVAVPEPTVLGMFSLGLAGLGLALRRRKSTRQAAEA